MLLSSPTEQEFNRFLLTEERKLDIEALRALDAICVRENIKLELNVNESCKPTNTLPEFQSKISIIYHKE